MTPYEEQVSSDLSAAEVLANLDRAWKNGEIPMLISNDKWGFGKAHLRVFRSSDEWVILIELLVYYNGFGDFDVVLYGFGNKLRRTGVNPNVTAAMPVVTFPSYELGLHVPDMYKGEYKDDDWWCNDPYELLIKLGGVEKRISLTDKDYATACVKLNDSISGDACLDRILQVFRALVYKLPQASLFPSDEFSFQRIGHKGLPKFIELEQWCHPGLGAISKPSKSPTFQDIASALQSGDKSSFCQPYELVNTNWWSWPAFSS